MKAEVKKKQCSAHAEVSSTELLHYGRLDAKGIDRQTLPGNIYYPMYGKVVWMHDVRLAIKELNLELIEKALPVDRFSPQSPPPPAAASGSPQCLTPCDGPLRHGGPRRHGRQRLHGRVR